jgi:hypothetical protein
MKPKNTICLCQSRKRRQHVMPDPQPSSCGSSPQGIPLRRTKRMPMRHARSGIRGRPPFGRVGGTGRSGAIRSHNRSGNSTAAINRGHYRAGLNASMLGHRARFVTPSYIHGYLSTISSLGDYGFNSPSHHGTPANRLGAALLGMLVADEGCEPESGSLISSSTTSSSISSFETQARIRRPHWANPLPLGCPKPSATRSPSGCP